MRKRAFAQRVALWLFVLFLLIPAREASASHSFTNFPAPSGFIEGSRLSPEIKNMATIGQVPPTELIGIYYSTNTLAEILNFGRSEGPAIFWKANFKGTSPSLLAAQEKYAELCKNAKRECSEAFDINNPKIKLILSHFEEATTKYKTNAVVKVQGAASLGIIVERKNILAVSGLVNIRNSNKEEGWTKDMPSVLVTGFLRIGQSQVDVALVYPFEGADSIEAANAKFLGWINQIETQYGLKDD